MRVKVKSLKDCIKNKFTPEQFEDSLPINRIVFVEEVKFLFNEETYYRYKHYEGEGFTPFDIPKSCIEEFIN